MRSIDFICRVTSALEQLGARYFISGSVASTLYGEVRHTQDVDIVLTLSVEQAESLAAMFPEPDYYCDLEAMKKLAKFGGMNNILSQEIMFKADLIKSRAGAYEELVFERRRRLAIAPGSLAWVASPEDVILAKLDAYLEGKSDKHLRDIAGMLRVQGDKIDRKYIDEWANRGAVYHLWVIAQKRVSDERAQ